jgi:Fur family ferric uptake transcriptional regulator
MRNFEDNKKTFYDFGIKMTKQRIGLIEQLKKASQPVTAEQLFLSLREGEASISLSTVYRILETFVLKGMVEKVVSSEDQKAVYELNRLEHRHHLICTRCKTMTTLPGCPLAGYEAKVETSTRFLITGHRLEVYGICPKCQTQSQLKDPVHE